MSTTYEDQIEMSLEWVQSLSVLNEVGKAVLKRLAEEHLRTRAWITLAELVQDLESHSVEAVEIAVDDLLMLSLLASAEAEDDEEESLIRISPQLAFDLDNTWNEITLEQDEE